MDAANRNIKMVELERKMVVTEDDGDRRTISESLLLTIDVFVSILLDEYYYYKKRHRSPSTVLSFFMYTLMLRRWQTPIDDHCGRPQVTGGGKEEEECPGNAVSRCQGRQT